MSRQAVIDSLQWAFDLAFGAIPRPLDPSAEPALLVGHRGVFQHPTILENTLPAFDLALACGGGIECDLHLTRDLVTVVHHDDTLWRVHGRPQAIQDLSFLELQELAPAVPSLREVLSRYARRRPHLFLEPKVQSPEQRARILESIWSELQEFDLTDRATLLSFHPGVLDLARQIAPELAKAMIFFVSPRSALSYLERHRDTGLAGWYFTFPKAWRTELERRGLHVGIGQVDYPNTLRHYQNQGFKVQFTNRIDRLALPLRSDPLASWHRDLMGAAG